MRTRFMAAAPDLTVGVGELGGEHVGPGAAATGGRGRRGGGCRAVGSAAGVEDRREGVGAAQLEEVVRGLGGVGIGRRLEVEGAI